MTGPGSQAELQFSGDVKAAGRAVQPSWKGTVLSRSIPYSLAQGFQDSGTLHLLLLQQHS